MREINQVFEVLDNKLLTTESTNYFIKNYESYLKGVVSESSIISSYPFLKEVSLVDLKKGFQKIRTNLLNRKKIRVYCPITISNNLIAILHPIFFKFAGSSIILDLNQDSSIVAGLKFSYEGKIYNLTVESLNQNKFDKNKITGY